MRFTTVALASLTLACSASAQYFSEGWKPGKPVSKAGTGYSYQPTPTGAAASQPTEPAIRKSPFDLSTYLESGPIKALFGRAGVNITEKLEAARQQENIWEERIPLITDDNYNDLIVGEKFSSLEEEKDRLWFIVISISSAQREGISRFVDEQFDKAFNLTQDAGDLQHVRWGRIDYMNVTAITTKWGVWRAPYLVVLKNAGHSLRFYRPGQIRLQAEILREFLKQDAYEQTEPWDSAFAPGGRREFVLDYLAVALTKIYNVTIMIPRWLLLVITGSIASLLVNLLHNSKGLFGTSEPASAPKPVVPKPVVKAEQSPAPAVDPAAASSATKTSKGGSTASKRKGGKK